ncbi:sensor histidine kinase [Aquimarina brevivitae]|uniref:histidine kinase n=1 Tax=Aquimarina brevivitae TaxID=323412 RepID=A0A4Q7NZ06_9FLAO|nr:ATP-binding protein [Aquimarina brevivitae]RZS92487.1 hypothetical protein EV197_2625 [Aquimarina brevivitae]
MLEKEEILLIIYFVVIIFFFVIFGIVFFIAFQRRKNKLLVDKIKAEQQFEEELQNSKLEIKEQTLKNVSWELHDNIGQLLSTAVMQINILGNSLGEEGTEALKDVRTLVGDSLQEIRSLSKTLNHEVIQNIGIEKSIQTELARFEKLNFLNTHFTVTGDTKTVNAKDEIILYRIVQEFFSNTIKHAEAENLFVHLEYTIDSFTITIKDDGVGFEMDNVQANSGLLNMRSRAALINATLTYKTAPDQGVELSLKYPFNNEV